MCTRDCGSVTIPNKGLWSIDSWFLDITPRMLEQHKATKHGRGQRVHFPGELPEYEKITRKYFDENVKITAYREQCKDEAFTLFSKWFYCLWD